ncbi:MAG: hypothetical protein RR847_00570 [Bacilli bacterium]
MEIITKIKEQIKSPIEEKGYILDDVLFKQDGSIYSLVIIIDKEPVVTVEDCVIISNLIDPIIDKLDLIEHSYVLDVCSREKGDK